MIYGKIQFKIKIDMPKYADQVQLKCLPGQMYKSCEEMPSRKPVLGTYKYILTRYFLPV